MNYRCPHCGSLLALPEPQEYHTTRLPWLRQGVLESFDFDAHQQFGGRQEHATALPTMQPAPGEYHEQRTYHRWETGDTKSHGGMLGITFVLSLAFSFAIVWVAGIRIAWAALISLVPAVLYWVFVVRAAFSNDKAIERFEEHERYPEPAPMPPQPQSQHTKPIQVEGTFHSQHGHIKRTSSLQLSCDPGCWCSFCHDVDAGKCNFSGRAATDHGLTPDEWTEALTAFHMHKWLASLGGSRSAPSLNRAGRWVVRQFASS